MKRVILLLSFLLLQNLAAQTGRIAGVVSDKKSGDRLVGANLELKEIRRGTVSDEDGTFVLQNVPRGNYTLVISYLGYEKARIPLAVEAGKTDKVEIQLLPTALAGKEVMVVATRAVEGETPAAFSTLTKEEIDSRYYAQDFPVLLSELPSTTFYSENGNGIGYNYLSIRGFGQRRISVMVNGIPQNEPEDHNVYWLDFPDLMGNVEDIQVQRGAGSAFYGPPAIGGSVNIVTSQFLQDAGAIAYAGYGSYNTRKYSLSLNSGLVKNHYVFFGRFSQIKSDGFREQSWTDFKSFFVGAARFGKRSSLRLHFFGGPVADHLAYYGIPKQDALNPEKRTANPIQRPDEIENFNQPHLELIHEYQLSKNLKLNNTLFGIRGYGFFDYDGSWAPLSYYRLTPEYGFDVQGNPEDIYVNSLLIRAYVDNKQAGWLPQLQWTHSHGQIVLGSEIRFHRSLHWGRVQKGSSDLPSAVSGDYRGLNYIGDRRYYEYRGAKDIISPYIHSFYRLRSDLLLMLDLQFAYNRYRLYDEKFIGTDFTLNYYFLNPRVGLNYNVSENLNIFGSVSRTSREPRLKNFYDAAEASTPQSWGAVNPQFELNSDANYNFDDPLVKPEKLNDFEAGLGYQGSQVKANLNFFYMDFRDEIVKQGQLDRFGQPVTGNADRASHTGVELSFQGNLWRSLTLSGNFTVSQNKLEKYSVFNSDGSEIVLDGNPIAGFPDILGNLRATYRFRDFQLSAGMRHVGKQYTNNYGDQSVFYGMAADNVVDPFTVFNGMIGYTFPSTAGLSGINLQLHVENIFNTIYILHGENDEFFPAAGRQVFMNARFDL